MKPVGAARVKKHLAELQAVLHVVKEDELAGMICALRIDPYRRDWVASFERIAENLPRIRMALTPFKPNDATKTAMSKWLNPLA